MIRLRKIGLRGKVTSQARVKFGRKTRREGTKGTIHDKTHVTVELPTSLRNLFTVLLVRTEGLSELFIVSYIPP